MNNSIPYNESVLYHDAPAVAVLRKIGDISQIAMPGAVLAFTAMRRDCHGFCNMVKAIAVTAAITHAAKFIADYTELGIRPNGKHGSFPSAHSSSAFEAWSYAQNYYNPKCESPTAITVIPSIIMFTFACVTAISRVMSHQHHVRDVIVGSMLGSFVAWCFAKPQPEPEAFKII